MPGDIVLVTRGHGEILVTTTGMGSEVGHIAHLLAGQKVEKTPLTKQVDRLTIFIIGAALFAFIAILIMGLAQGESFTVLFGIGVALAVGSIPDALPAVVTTILSVGSVNMAKKNAIMKVLPAVETLGSTSAINSDKTGTLTLNQMTVREFSTVAHLYTVSGEGYSFDGQCSARWVMPRPTWTPCASRARSATIPTSRMAPWSATPPRARCTSLLRRAASTSGSSVRATLESQPCRSTPTTSSWPPSTRCPGLMVNPSYVRM